MGRKPSEFPGKAGKRTASAVALQRSEIEWRAKRLGHALGRWEHDIVLGPFDVAWCRCGAYVFRDPETGASRGPAMSMPHLLYPLRHAMRRASLPCSCYGE